MELSPYHIAELNAEYRLLSLRERMQQLFSDFDRVLITSSFGTTSAVMLHLVSRVQPQQPIHFIDTRYLFKQTLRYRNNLQTMWKLNIVDLKADEAGHRYTLENELWKSEPDVCCGINKTMPVEEVRPDFQVWVAGLLGYQNDFRQGLNFFEMKGGILRFYPLLDLDREDILAYYEDHNLPRHPLQALGYGSVGCVHCTVPGQGRNGRWLGKIKTECGLHT